MAKVSDFPVLPESTWGDLSKVIAALPQGVLWSHNGFMEFDGHLKPIKSWTIKNVEATPQMIYLRREGSSDKWVYDVLSHAFGPMGGYRVELPPDQLMGALDIALSDRGILEDSIIAPSGPFPLLRGDHRFRPPFE